MLLLVRAAFLAMILCPLLTLAQDGCPTAAIDLSKADLNSPQMLDGSWCLLWQPGIGSNKPQSYLLPKVMPWNNFQTVSNLKLPSVGHGRYHTKVILPRNPPPILLIQLEQINSDYEFKINGSLVSYRGNDIALKSDSNKALENLHFIFVDTSNKNFTFDVDVLVSNSDFNDGGIIKPPIIGSASSVIFSIFLSHGIIVFVAGILFLMSCFSIVIFLRNRRDFTPLTFGAFNLFLCIRLLLSNHLNLVFEPFLTKEIIYRINYFAIISSVYLCHLYIMLFYRDFSREIYRIISSGIFATFCITIISAPLFLLDYMLYAFYLYTLLVMIHISHISICAIRNKCSHHKLMALSVVAFCIFNIPAFFMPVFIYNLTWQNMSLVLFAVIHGAIQSLKHSYNFYTLENTNNDLENTVALRTMELSKKNEEALIAHKETRTLTRALTELIEDERRIFAMELHDDLGQNVSSAQLLTQRIENKLRRIGANSEPELNNVLTLTQELDNDLGKIYSRIRHLARSIRPEVIDTLGLEVAIKELLNKYTHLDFEITFTHTGDLSEIPPKIALTIYRCCQESLTNIVKYSRASEVEVFITANSNMASFSIEDNGIGFDANNKKGIGLISMRERIHDHGGSFFVDSKSFIGTKISASIPYTVD